MDFDRLDAELQLIGDLAVNVPARDQFDDLGFAVGELGFGAALVCARAHESRDDLHGQFGVDAHTTECDLPDCATSSSAAARLRM